MEQENKIHVFGDIYFHVPVSTADRPIETLFGNLPKEDQYWRRQTDFVINTTYPKIFYDYNPHLPIKQLCRINASKTYYYGDKLVSLSVEDTQALISLVQREVNRRERGIFIMNDGVRIYFPGFYYGMLQYGKMIGVEGNDGYGQHWEYQRIFACQRLKCIEDDKIIAYYLDKIKKCGGTQMISLFWTDESIMIKQFSAAAMSKNHDTAKSANFKYYSYALKNYPKILLPTIEQKSWASAVQKIQIRSSNHELSFENTVCAVASVTDGLDGLPLLKRIGLSEMPKMTEAEKILTKSKEQARMQKTKIGIIEIESYPPEEDTQSFKYCRDLYTKDCMDLDEFGYPKNGIIPLYIGLLDATNGTHDIYGKPDKMKALRLEQAELDKCNTPAKIQARKRQYHMTVKESWASGGGGSVYNNIMLAEQKTILEEEYSFGKLNYISGNLEWTAGQFTPVRFVPLTHEEIMAGKTAKWRVYCSNEYMAKNTNLCFKMPRKKKKINGEIHELLQPPQDIIHVSGTDPVDYAFVTEMGKKQSQNASTILDIEGNLLSVYWFRDQDPDVAIDDFCKEQIFWGTYSLVEGNRKNAVTTLEKLGMYYFLLTRHPNGQVLPYSQAINIKHISSSKEIKALYISLIMKRITNEVFKIKCIEIIGQLMDFEPDNTQEYDLGVCYGLAEIALDAMQTWVTSKKMKGDQYAGLGQAISAVMGIT